MSNNACVLCSKLMLSVPSNHSSLNTFFAGICRLYFQELATQVEIDPLPHPYKVTKSVRPWTPK
jgi:hypothetical protein